MLGDRETKPLGLVQTSVILGQGEIYRSVTSEQSEGEMRLVWEVGDRRCGRAEAHFPGEVR